MLSDGLPVRIEPARLAEQGRSLTGRVRLADLKRLAPALDSTEGFVQVALNFGIDDSGRRYIAGRIEAELVLTCQRCLESMRLAVSAEPLLGIIEDAAEAELLPDEYDPLVVGREPLFLRDMIEDELILSLPVVPRHSDEDCRKDGAEEGKVEQGERKNPFAVLAELKRD